MSSDEAKTLDYIVSVVVNIYDITTDDIMRRTRKRTCVWPRQVACALIRETLARNVTLSEIGDKMGNIHYSTVLHGMTQVANIRETDKLFAKVYAEALDVISKHQNEITEHSKN